MRLDDRAMAALAILASVSLVGLHARALSRETVLFRFSGGTHGANPYGGVAVLSSGAVLGTTYDGGQRRRGGFGTLYLLAPSSNGYTTKALYSFSGGDGAYPTARLIGDGTGSLYGTTVAGGSNGAGTVFKLTPAGQSYTLTVLYDFRGAPDGATPYGELLVDETGALYGTTFAGGTFGGGTVFKLTPSGSGYSESVAYNFGSGTDGANPYAGLIEDSSGDFYGTTYFGGTYSDGTVFELLRSGSEYSEIVLHDFQGDFDGAYPWSALTADGAGSLYGTTVNGGGPHGYGTVFKLTPYGSSYIESIAYAFQGGSDGINPYGGLWAALDGEFYGTTYGGGSFGLGSVYRLRHSGSRYVESVLYSFAGGLDGAHPWAGLVADGSGALYGTTVLGGSSACGGGGCGTVFRLKP